MADLIRDNQTEWNKRSVVFIHGIGMQAETYAERLVDRLHREDPDTADATRWFSIHYDDVNDAIEKKVRAFKKVLQKGRQALAVPTDFFVDLFNYLLSGNVRHWIDNDVKRTLVEMVQQAQRNHVSAHDHKVTIIAHSLGTVVAYEVLHAIINDAQTLGITSGFKIDTYFTLGSPLAFIQAHKNKIPKLSPELALNRFPISRPVYEGAFTGKQSNVASWINLRQKWDPVGSLVALEKDKYPDSLTEETRVFENFNAGPNPHDLGNYIEEYKGLIMEKLRA